MNTKRIGLALVGNHPCSDLVAYANLAEECGYESVWAPEDLGMRDGITPLAAFAVTTKRVGLATGILPIHYRPPALTAMTFATLDEVSHGRMILALGHGLLPWLAQLGIRIGKPTTAMKEYTQILREFWAGRTVDYKGSVYTIKNVKLAFNPIRPRIPIYFAARGPKMFQLAGEIADGVLNNEGLTSRQYFDWVKNNLAEGAEKSGRKVSNLDLAAYVFTSVADGHDEAKERIKPPVISMLAQGDLTPHLERLGSSITEAAPTIGAWNKGDVKSACKLVPESLLENAAIYGTPAECERKMEHFRSLGITLPIILPVGDFKKTIRAAMNW